MKQFIYADNAATTKLDSYAFEVMKPYLLEEYGNISQPYSFSRNPKKAVRQAREVIAECINAEPDEIYFTSGGSESDNWAIKGCAFADYDKKPMITSAIEHHALLNACSFIETMLYPVAYLFPDSNGVISPDKLESIISDSTRMVSIMYANNEIGTIQPIKELSAVAHRHGAIFHTDAVQALGHIKIDVCDMGIDMLSASAHKFNGPKGIGFLYIKNGINIAPLIHGGNQEKNMRAGTENTAAIVGMACALKKNCDNIDKNAEFITQLENTLIEKLNQEDIPYVHNCNVKHIPGNISISFPGFEGEAIMHRLDLMGIQVSTGAACDSVNTKASHVLEAINQDPKIALGTIRISLGVNNTIEDVFAIAQALKKIVKQ